MTAPRAPVRVLPWDSEFFGLTVGRIETDRLDQATLDETLQWCRAHKIELLYFLARPDDEETTHLVESAGFHLVDQRITLEHSLAGTVQPLDSTDLSIRDWESGDLPALETMARSNHRDSRFYFDRHLPDNRCDELYATWIRNSCHGWADRVLVAMTEDQPVGYISCHLDEDAGRIGLLGVDGRTRGRGVGSLLIREALSWFVERTVRRVLVVTQGRNIAAQRLYQAQGFRTRSLFLYYHYRP